MTMSHSADMHSNTRCWCGWRDKMDDWSIL